MDTHATNTWDMERRGGGGHHLVTIDTFRLGFIYDYSRMDGMSTRFFLASSSVVGYNDREKVHQDPWERKTFETQRKNFQKNCHFHFFVGKLNEGGDIEGNDDDDEYRTGGQTKCVSYSKIHVESWRFSDGFHRSLIINILEKENQWLPALFVCIERKRKRVHIEFWWRMWLQDKVDTFFTRTSSKRLFSYLLFAQCLLSCPSTICSMKCRPFSSQNNFPFIPFSF